jgi:hypothetical protein
MRGIDGEGVCGWRKAAIDRVIMSISVEPILGAGPEYNEQKYKEKGAT